MPMSGDAWHCADVVHRKPQSIDFDEARFRCGYRDTTYFSCGREWSDYETAYRYGCLTHAAYSGVRFEAAEAELAQAWAMLQSDSRLQWVEARGAIWDVWRYLDETALGNAGTWRGRAKLVTS